MRNALIDAIVTAVGNISNLGCSVLASWDNSRNPSAAQIVVSAKVAPVLQDAAGRACAWSAEVSVTAITHAGDDASGAVRKAASSKVWSWLMGLTPASITVTGYTVDAIMEESQDQTEPWGEEFVGEPVSFNLMISK
jgi:hypothetical protein